MIQSNLDLAVQSHILVLPIIQLQEKVFFS